MATTISTQDIIDAKRDIDDIGKAVNEKVVVSPRYGEDFKSLPMIADEAQGAISEWEAAISLITQEGGVPALAVSDASGLTQQKINDGLDSIAELLSIPNPFNGMRVFVESYRAGEGKGGGWFIFDETKVSFTDEFGRVVTNDKGRFINGWVRQVPDNEFTPEMWGAYGEAEKLGQDDWQAIEDMFQSLMPCGTGADMSWSELGVAWNRGQKRVVRLDGLYKHSKTIFIPPNIKVKQSNWQATHSRKITQGFWYSPAESERSTTCAVSNYVYSKIDPSVSNPVNARWYLNKDIFYIPEAGDEGSKYYAFGWNIDLDQLTIITDQDVALGLRWINVINGTTDNLTIGGYTNGVSYQNPRCPRVGFVHFDSYVSKHRNTRINADVQGIVTSGSNAGVVFNDPWLTQTKRAQKSSSYVPLYKRASHTETGSVAITYLGGEAHYNNPVYENWNIHVLAIDSKYVSVYRPHNESLVLKHEFYLINSSLKAELKSSFGHYSNGATFTDFDGSPVTYSNYSAVYLKNCGSDCGVEFTGMVRYGSGVLLRGEASERIVELDYLITEVTSFISYGRIGDISLLRKANWGDLGYTDLYVNAATGDDINSGLSRTRPRKTLNAISDYVDRCGIETVILTGDVTASKDVTLPKSPVLITSEAKTLNMGNYRLLGQSKLDITLGSSLALNAAANLISTSNPSHSSIRVNSNFTIGGAVVYSGGSSNVDLLINNTTAACAAYFSAALPATNQLGISVVTTSAIPATQFTAGVCIKYKSANITQAS